MDALPPYTPPPFPVPEAERVTLFDWMVLTCYPEELNRQRHLAGLREVQESFAQGQQQQQLPLQLRANGGGGGGGGAEDAGRLRLD